MTAGKSREMTTEDMIRIQLVRIDNLLPNGWKVEIDPEAILEQNGACRLHNKQGQVHSTFLFETMGEALAWCYGVDQALLMGHS